MNEPLTYQQVKECGSQEGGNDSNVLVCIKQPRLRGLTWEEGAEMLMGKDN